MTALNGDDPWRRGLVVSLAAWRRAVDAARLKGVNDRTAWGPATVRHSPGALSGEIDDIEGELSTRLPASIRRVLEWSAAVDVTWVLSDSVVPPEPYALVTSCRLSWSLDRLVALHQTYSDWVTEVFPNPDDPYDKVWHDKTPFLAAPNGDIIALDTAEQVIYLSHEDGEGHGLVLGSNLLSFLVSWSALGCPGPEAWQWLPFWSESEGGLHADGPTATEWRSWFGLSGVPTTE